MRRDCGAVAPSKGGRAKNQIEKIISTVPPCGEISSGRAEGLRPPSRLACRRYEVSRPPWAGPESRPPAARKTRQRACHAPLPPAHGGSAKWSFLLKKDALIPPFPPPPKPLRQQLFNERDFTMKSKHRLCKWDEKPPSPPMEEIARIIADAVKRLMVLRTPSGTNQKNILQTT